MKTYILSYSRTGNNQILADTLAENLSAEHLRITEPRPRTFLSIGIDILFNRKPKINPININLQPDDFVVLVGPVWMGHIATPFRSFLKQYKKILQHYAFVSISGGFDGPNQKLASELKKRTGHEAQTVINFLIKDLLPSNPEPTRQDTEDYRLTRENSLKLIHSIVFNIHKQN